MLRLQRFIELTTSKSPLAIVNRRSGSWRKSFRRRARRGMKKASIIGAQSLYGASRRGEKAAVNQAPPPPPQPPSIVSPSAPAGHEISDSDSLRPSLVTNVHGKRGRDEDVLTAARGRSSRVGKKRKMSRFQKAKKYLKRMKAEVEKQRAETKQMRLVLMEETAKFQAAAEGIESILAQASAENELTLEQNLQDQHLLMLGWTYVLDADDI